MTPTLQILQGDCRATLKTLPDESVHCVVTSPPYWGLRDYGCAGQIGLEASLGDFIAQMVDVFREVRRVLRKDGTCWVNFGDSYASDAMNNGGYSEKSTLAGFTNPNTKGRAQNEITKPRKRIHGLKPKDLCGVPWRVAFALQADGWWLRQDIIWHKPNPMPESVRDRCTKAHEYLFLMTKAASYFWDADAMKEEASVGNCGSSFVSEYDMKTKPGLGTGTRKDDGTRNRRSVWTVPTQPYSEAHFATYPPSLIRPCILAGCPVGGTVLDPFGGSGTTGQVALELGRSAILCELNPEYVKLIERRCAVTPGLALS